MTRSYSHSSVIGKYTVLYPIWNYCPSTHVYAIGQAVQATDPRLFSKFLEGRLDIASVFVKGQLL